MLLVIFGAGASCDSDHRRPYGGASAQWRPPLTDGLFADREELRDAFTRFPRVLPLLARLGQTASATTLEERLSELQAEGSSHPARHSDIASVQYYLQVLIWECERFWLEHTQGATNYLSLLDRVQRWRGDRENVLFVTFNYDRLFDCAASFYMSNAARGHESDYKTMASYLEGPFPLLKLHGSLDWGRKVNTPLKALEQGGEAPWDVAYEIIARAANLELSGDIAKTTQRPPDIQNGVAYMPALAIPANGKSFACPDSHLDFLVAQLPKVRSVLTIGWRGMEEHFLALLREYLKPGATALTVSGTTGASLETMAQLRSAGIDTGSVYAEGFSQLVVAKTLDDFLKVALA